MPPIHNYCFRALFYYTIARTADEYWVNEGKYWSKMSTGSSTRQAFGIANQIVSPTDTPEQKLQKSTAQS